VCAGALVRVAGPRVTSERKRRGGEGEGDHTLNSNLAIPGVSRMLYACAAFVMPWDAAQEVSSAAPAFNIASAITIDSRVQLNDLLDRLEFAQKALELLASTHLMPCDRYHITDPNAAPWLLHTCAVLLALHRAEEGFYRRLQVRKPEAESSESEDPEPCLIERSMMDDLLYIAEKLGDLRAERGLQVALVLGVLGSFDDLAARKLEARTPPAIPAFNPDLVELALQVAKSVLGMSTMVDTDVQEGGWEFDKEKHGPITKISLSRGKGQPALVLDGSHWHTAVCVGEKEREGMR
jgi:hypothetical protein